MFPRDTALIFELLKLICSRETISINMNTLAVASAMEVVTVSALASNHIIHHENTQFYTVALVSVFSGINQSIKDFLPPKNPAYSVTFIFLLS